MHATLHVGCELLVHHEGNLMAAYRFGPDVPKPYFHPVLLGTGNQSPLTLASPHDHVHHRGLWFAWKFLNGENFWEERPGCHGATMRRLEVEQDTRREVRWTADLDWQLQHGDVLLSERRTLRVGRPSGDGDAWRYPIDFDSIFTAAQAPVHLSLLTVQEQAWGGYAGLGYRPARGMDVQAQVLTSNGPASTADKGVPARWADYSGGLDGSTQYGGIAIFDHPENPRHPPPFFVLSPPPFGFLNPSFLFREGMTLSTGESLRLRYRVLVHAGRGQQDDLTQEFSRWVGGDGEG